MSAAPARHFAIVPAAGTGSRLGAALPKQYLPIGERPLLAWSVAPLVRAGWIERVYVVVAPDDERAGSLFAGEPRVAVVACGGASRRDSVLNMLRDLPAADDDWVLVHDAARPGLDDATLGRLRDALVGGDAGDGGLLALPVADTVKRADDRQRVRDTLSREGLWLAQTPQMFRRGALLAALERHPHVTDEAGAIEADGRPVRLVRGALANFKVTTADDLLVMRRLLQDREEAG